MSDNPFAEPDDSNRTIIRPNPGRRRSSAPAQAPGQQPTGGDTRAEPNPRAPDVARAAPVSEGTENIHVGDDVPDDVDGAKGHEEATRPLGFLADHAVPERDRLVQDAGGEAAGSLRE